MIRYNTGFMEGFVTEDELKAIAPEVENASKALRNGTGLGNDFIGWRDLPVDFDKEEYARIKAAAKRVLLTWLVMQ